MSGNDDAAATQEGSARDAFESTRPRDESDDEGDFEDLTMAMANANDNAHGVHHVTSSRNSPLESRIADKDRSRSEDAVASVAQGMSREYDERELFGASSDEEGSGEDVRHRAVDDQEDVPDEDEEDDSRADVKYEDVEVTDVQNIQGGADTKLFLADLPNFLLVDPKPFDPDHYETTEKMEDHEIKLRIENTIRWRYIIDHAGKLAQQSNTHMVRWSDGSMSLLMGDELIDLSTAPVVNHQYIVSVNKGDKIIRIEAPLADKMMFRPFDTKGKTHQSMAMLRTTKFRKTGKTKLVSMDKDPELIKQEAEKAESERIKARKKLESKRRSLNNRYSHRMTEGALEHFSDDDAEGYDGSSGARASTRGRGADVRGGIGGPYRSGAGDDDIDDLNEFVVDDDDDVLHYNEEDEAAERLRDEMLLVVRRSAGNETGEHVTRDRESERDRERERERRKLEKERERKVKRLERETGELSDDGREERQRRSQQRTSENRYGTEGEIETQQSRGPNSSVSKADEDEEIGDDGDDQFAVQKRPKRQRAIFSSDEEEAE